MIDVVWNILEKSYKNVGGLKSCDSTKKLLKNGDMFSVVKNSNGEILSVSIYRKVGEGFKSMYCDTNGTSEGKLALQGIIVRDIENIGLHHYIECSGSIEHYFKKHNGYPIPNDYVPTILGNFNGELLEDGFHYKRRIGGSEELYQKCMFGFANEEIYNELIEDYLVYIGFKETVNSDTKFYEGKLYNYPSNIFKCISIIEFIRECHEENDLNELCEEMYNALLKCLKTLSDYKEKNSQIKYAISTCQELINEMPLIKLHTISM